jgi:hypothetical protein
MPAQGALNLKADPMRFSLARRLASALAVLLCLAACDAPSSSPTAVSPAEDTRSAPQANVPGLRQRQLAFLNRIRQADPSETTIDRALLNEQNELGLVLDRRVEMDKIPALLRSIMTEMAGEFPGQDLTVLAYAPSNPPQKIGTAHLDARTREMTYVPAH